ncbi:efflux ABC transporter, transmembrane ATP-binding protein [Rhodobacterales bacterium HTCC2150]|nr:efflux ABC transporter, transmembrane ATP-binding protein [Rhodobacterales bacterium HTCC2150] [Rhodobacteraceae bacterium HTCC2150]
MVLQSACHQLLEQQLAGKDKISTRINSRQLIARVWREYLAKRWPLLLIATLLMAIEGSMAGALSYMLQPMFDLVFIQGDQDALTWVCGVIFGISLLRAVTGIAQRTLMSKIANETVAELKKNMLRKFMALESGFFLDHSPGELVTRVQEDTGAIGSVWTAVIRGAGRDSIALISLFAVAISVDITWTLAAVIGTPLLILPSMVLQRYVRKKIGFVRVAVSALTTRLDEIFHGIDAIKFNAIEDYQAKQFGDKLDHTVRQQIKSAAAMSSMPGVVDVVTGIGLVAVLFFAAGDIISGEKTVGQFMSFFTAIALAFEPMRRLGGIAGVWQAAAASLDRIYEILDREPKISTPKNGMSLTITAPEIQFDAVQLAYGEKQILQGLSFTAEAGKTTAIVGPSAAGKTTLYRLMARMVDADKGRVLVNGQDVKTLDLGQLRAMFSIVAQDTLLFDETLRENILLGRSDVTDAELDVALNAANVSEFLDSFPDGLETEVGPRGARLSGGQRQRVAIARAVLRNTPVLLLDEPTSALDAKSEKLVQAAIDKMGRGQTVLVIAHRLSTVINADKIIVVDQGRVVEEGKHATLMKQGGVYRMLHDLQNAAAKE